MNWNPVKRWQKKHRRTEIEALKGRWLPQVYDLGEIRWTARLASTADGRGEIPPNSSTGEASGARESDVRHLWESPDLKLAGAEAAMLYGIGIWDNFTSVDAHVYAAMSALGGEHVDNILDLHHALEPWKHDLWGLTDKGLDALKGHVGEQYAAEAFHQGGVQVGMAATPNNPGWDLIVGSHEVNVKTVEDASSLYEHFSKYPDIAAAVPNDLHVPSGFEQFHFVSGETTAQSLHDFLASDAPKHVIVVDSMSGDAIAQHTHTAANLASEGFAAHEAVGFDLGHVPWITLATTGWREYKLLRDDKTDTAHAAINLSVDVTGRAGGAFIGAKAGAVAGSFVAGPIGTAIGGVLGAIGGAISGAMVANNYKQKDLKEAVEHYHAQAAKLEEAQRSAEQDASSTFDLAKRNEEIDLKSLKTTCREVIEFSQKSVVEHQAQARDISENECLILLQDAKSELAQEIERAKDRYCKHSWFSRWIWITPEVIADEELLVMLSGRSKHLESKQIGGEGGRPHLFGWLAASGYAKDQVSAWCHQFEIKLREREAFYRDVVVKAQIKAIDARKQAIERLNKKAAEIASQVRNRLSTHVEQVHAAAAKVKLEQGRLGLA